MKSENLKSYPSVSMVKSIIPADIFSILEHAKVTITHHMRHKPYFEIDKATFEQKLAPYWAYSHIQVFERSRDGVYTLVGHTDDDGADELTVVLLDKQENIGEPIGNPFGYFDEIYKGKPATHTIYNGNHHKYVLVFDLTSECIFSNDEMKTFFHDLFSRNLFECHIDVMLNNHSVFTDMVNSRNLAEPYTYNKQDVINDIMSRVNETAFYRETLLQYLSEYLPS